jgi:hypothetical protein
VLGHAEGPSEDRLGRRGAQEDEHLGPDPCQLGLQPRGARLDLLEVGFAVDPSLAAHHVREVLHDVREVDVVADKAGLLDRAIEERACRSHEGLAGKILLVAGLFADHHDPGILGSLAEHGLGGVAVQVAAAAPRRGLAKGGEGGAFR